MKEQILAKRIERFPEDDFMTDEKIKKNVYFAMDEYAKLVAIDFIESLRKDKYQFSINTVSSEELYNIYNRPK